MNNFRSAMIDASAIIGVGLISYGSWLIFSPAGFIVCGCLFLSGAVVATKVGA